MRGWALRQALLWRIELGADKFQFHGFQGLKIVKSLKLSIIQSLGKVINYSQGGGPPRGKLRYTGWAADRARAKRSHCRLDTPGQTPESTQTAMTWPPFSPGGLWLRSQVEPAPWTPDSSIRFPPGVKTCCMEKGLGSEHQRLFPARRQSGLQVRFHLGCSLPCLSLPSSVWSLGAFRAS